MDSRTDPGGAVTGYLHSAYAHALRECGTPRELPHCGGWMLERPVPNAARRDLMGCYPLFCCRDWSGIRADLRELRDGFVSLVAVADPFGGFTESDLQSSFDLVRPFKQHFIVDVRAPGGSAHHRYYARRALRSVKIEPMENPGVFAADWARLYAHLIARNELTGVSAFSAESLALQLCVPGAVLLCARENDAAVAAQLWYVQGDVAYSHLTAVDERGYRLRASYAIYAAAIEHFRGKVRWLDLGSSAGLQEKADDGLARFKRGWATGSRTAYLCGSILHRASYRRLSTASPAVALDYFPLYRAGEFRREDAL